MNLEFWGPDDYDLKAQKHYEAGELDAAVKILREGTAIYPEVAELRVSLGYTELAREEFAWARRAFVGALRLEPDHEDALVGHGETLLKLGERGRAFRAFDRVLELGFSEDADLMLSIGRILLREALFERAERFLRLAASADSNGAEALTDLGSVLQQLERLDEAQEWYERALRRDPENHDARILLGNLVYESGNRRAALAHFERIPTVALWDTLTIWRIVELKRAFDESGPESGITPYIARLEDLFAGVMPEDQLIDDLVTGLAGTSDSSHFVPGQMDMFRPGAERGSTQGEERLQDWEGIVQAMCRSSAEPERSLLQYMKDTARRIRVLTGIRIPDDDPEAFLKASATAGVLHIAD
jgi:Tfp pilus assembly protein PilF